MQISLKGRTALVTGGSMGLGYAMAETFAGAGAEVALVARRADVLEKAKAEIAGKTGARVEAYPCDVMDAQQIAATFAAAERDFGKVDILVNNAGRSATKPFTDITDREWQDDLDLKFFAAVRFGRLAFAKMKERRWGRIVNVLNTHAKAPAAGSMPTSVSRAAGMALTKVMANEGAPHNVLVNAMLVGLIESDQWVRRHAAAGENRPYEEFLADLGKRVPLGRIGRAQEFANMACLLVSDAGGFVTGTAINVDGGACAVV